MPNKLTTHSYNLLAAATLVIAVSVGEVRASTVWNESTNGDLSNSQSTPTSLSLTSGLNSVFGSVGPGDQQDWISLTVPSGFGLTSVVLAGYVSADGQGFTGFQVGSSFVGSPFSAASYAGYAHFGTAAGNGSLPPANLVGTDLLPLMANNAPGGTSPGASGFTQPLGPGTYTFLIQQLGGLTSYQFDYGVTVAPEPSTLLLAALAGGLMLVKRRRV